MIPRFDILYVTGRKFLCLKEEEQEKKDKRVIANYLFLQYKQKDKYFKTIQDWAVSQCSWGNAVNNPAYIIVEDMDAYAEQTLRKSVGLPPKQSEPSLEEKVADLINNGWSLKGDTHWDMSGIGTQMVVKLIPAPIPRP